MTEDTTADDQSPEVLAAIAIVQQENKDVVKRFIDELWCNGNLAIIDELCAPSFELHDPSLPSYLVLGRAGLKELVNRVRTAFPDFEVTIDEQIAEDDKVITSVTQRGTHLGPLQDLLPTGRRIELRATSTDRVVNGKIVASWGSSDGKSLLMQLGLVARDGDTLETRHL